MELLVVPALLAFSIVFFLSHKMNKALMVREGRGISQPWILAARKAGLTDPCGGAELFPGSTLLTTSLGPHSLRLSSRHEETGGPGVRLVVQGRPGITLRAEGAVRALERATTAREIEIGDVAFDREVYVHGTQERLRAALDVETRRVLLPLLQGRIPVRGAPQDTIRAQFSIRDGDIVVDFGTSATYQLRTNFAAAVKPLGEVADRLAPPASLLARIVQNTRREPEWQVRLENVRLLVRQFLRDPSTLEALRHACEDQDYEVKLEAALGLGPDQAEGTLREIAFGERSADPLAARAIVALDRRLTCEQLQPVLSHAVRTRRHETARACLTTLGAIGGALVVEPLAQVLALNTRVLALDTGGIAVAAARALGASRAEEAQAPLLAALESSASEVRVAAAEALGRVGQASAVLPLREIAGQNRLDTTLRKAARESIAAIQSRLGGASPGQLTLAAGQGGALSLADEDPHGRVSITEDP